VKRVGAKEDVGGCLKNVVKSRHLTAEKLTTAFLPQGEIFLFDSVYSNICDCSWKRVEWGRWGSICRASLTVRALS